MEAIGGDVAESNYQGIQQFLTDSPWDHRAVTLQIAKDVDVMLGGHEDTALYLDESAFVKKGDASVGVQRQYNGRLGKIENSQVGVFAAMGRGNRSSLIDFRLFLPEAWAKDAKRCDKVKIPLEHRLHKTKTALALDLVVAAVARGSTHRWIGGDAAYGTCRELTDALDDMGQVYVMDVSSTLGVWETNPCGQNEAAESNSPISVSDLASRYFAENSEVVEIRETTRGLLRAPIWVCTVWLWTKGENRARERRLIVRQEQDGTYKYSMSNVVKNCTIGRLAFMQAQRYWIEASFQEAKSELGMAHYELRGWLGWHHHMTLVCLAMSFLLKEKLLESESTPLLSARDIVELLNHFLPRRNIDETEILNQMERRHAARQRDIQNRRRRQNSKPSVVS